MNLRIYGKGKRTLNAPWRWKETMEFVTNTIHYPDQHHKRSNSESGCSAEKKLFGWSIAQKREDRTG